MLQAAAARNNALWCNAVCAAHGQPGEFHATHWLTRGGAPKYYPDLVTLAEAPPNTALDGLRAIKDSFRSLDLSPAGFRPLFDAEWITASKAPATPGLTWSTITTPEALHRWESLWSGATPSGLFPASLLAAPEISFVVAQRGATPIGGGILNRGAGVTGLSNLFTLEADLVPIWQGLAQLAEARFALPVVGYDRGDDLAAAYRAGLTRIGKLRVWTR